MNKNNNKQQTYVFKVSDNLRDEIIEHYKDTMRPKKPPYSVFQADDGAGTIVTLYESGKIMFQGISADIDYKWWRDREKFLNKRDIDSDIKKEKDKKERKEENAKKETLIFHNASTIGSDEVGTGDYFGPIVVTASFVPESIIPYLNGLGIRDSKKITDEKIKSIVPKIKDKITYESFILYPEDYNKWKIYNMNAVKAILHNRVLSILEDKVKGMYDYAVVDEFCSPYNYYKHIEKASKKATDITFTPHAEDKCYAVAVSSIISRYIFLREMNKMSSVYGEVPKGAGKDVDAYAKDLVKKYGESILYKLCKINFKNTNRILNKES